MSQIMKVISVIIIGAVLVSAIPAGAAETQPQEFMQKEKADKLFDWAESLVAEVFVPLDTETRYFLGIHYRHYHESDTMLCTFNGDFFYIDGEDISYLGEVDYWLKYIDEIETVNFYGNLLKSILKGLSNAAGKKLSGEVLGYILSLLGWGDDGNSADHKLLEDMESKLDDILNILVDVIEELGRLEKILAIQEQEILANVNDPTAAITQIGTFQAELQNLNKDMKPGSISKQIILDFAQKVENNYQIENDVNTIHDAILPPTIVKSPVLDNLTDLCINRVSGGQDLMDAYRMLELYFSQLLYNQLRGVNLVVEAKLAREMDGYYQEGAAKHYMDNYQKNILVPQVENFQNNVWRLILADVDLINAYTFLPSQARQILARADFFVAQVLGESAGLRGYIISTTDLLDDAPSLSATLHNDSETDSNITSWIDPVSFKMNTASGKPYDHWKGNRVSRVSDYYVISYNFGIQEPGQYDIYLKDTSGTLHLASSSVVEKYNQDYEKDAQGDVNYGSFLISNRVGAKDAFDHHPVWKWHAWDLKNVSANGNESTWYVEIVGGGQNLTYGGKGGLYATFVYAGEKSAPITIHYHARVRGSTSSSASTQTSGHAKTRIYYAVGIADAYTGHFLHHDVGSKTTGDSGSASLDITVGTTWTFNDPVPGREYFIYFKVEASGESYRGTAKSSIKVDSIKGHQYVSF